MKDEKLIYELVGYYEPMSSNFGFRQLVFINNGKLYIQEISKKNRIIKMQPFDNSYIELTQVNNQISENKNAMFSFKYMNNIFLGNREQLKTEINENIDKEILKKESPFIFLDLLYFLEVEKSTILSHIMNIQKFTTSKSIIRWCEKEKNKIYEEIHGNPKNLKNSIV